MFPLLALLACGAADDTGAQEALASVEVAPVTTADLSRELVFTVDLEPDRSAAVYSPMTDRVVSFSVDDGDFVRTGQRLAVMRNEGISANVAQLQRQVDSAEAQLTQATADLERSEQLFENQVITRQQLEQARTAQVSARAQRDGAQAALDQIQVTARDAAITAPISGIVANRSVDPGDMASPQAPLLSILDTDPLRFDLQVSPRDAASIEVGAEVEVTVDALPGEVYSAEVSRVLPYMDAATRKNTVEVELTEPGSINAGPLKPGMFARATLHVDERRGVVVAPERGLMLSGDDPSVRRAFVVTEGVARERLVKVGVREGDSYEVVDGLEAGEQLVVRGQHSLTDGEQVGGEL